MLQELIDHSQDLKKIQEEGYELNIVNGYGTISHIPYIKANGEIDYGTLVSSIAFCGDTAKYDGNHVIYFSGEQPHNIDGTEIVQIKHGNSESMLAGINIKCSFSNKPSSNYKDYYEKFTNYINIISFPAIAKDETVTAKTFKNILTRENSVFEYADTNSSRAGIDTCNDKLSNKRVGIIGLGGTGSYILDLISKTNIEEIHLFDGDCFCQHNAFRSPGAAEKSILEKGIAKTEYFQSEYKNMHKNIFAHSMFVTQQNIDELSGLDFVFISLDSGEARKVIAEYLVSQKIPFVDTGMGLQYLNGCINGQIRTSLFDVNNYNKIYNYLDFQEDGDDVYNTNIQIAECNALNAVLAVIEFKRYFGIYDNTNQYRQGVYSIDMGGMICEE